MYKCGCTSRLHHVTTMTQRPITYFVYGAESMALSVRSTWVTTLSDATTVADLKRDLVGEPYVPKNFTVLVAATTNPASALAFEPTQWFTERTLQDRGQLPEGAALDVRIMSVPADQASCVVS